MKRWLSIFIAIASLITATPALAQTALSTTTCPGTGCDLELTAGSGTVSVQIVGTFTGTLQFEQSNDGATWVALNVYAAGSTTAVTSATAAGLWNAPVSTKQIRIRFSAYTSGTATVYVSTTAARSNGSMFPITLTFPILGPDGTTSAPTYGFASQSGTGMSGGVGVLQFSVANAVIARLDTGGIGFGGNDTYLVRDGASDTLSQRRSTNAQVFRSYNTFTDASNYERLVIGWGGIAANTAEVSVGAAGTGASRALLIGTANGSSGLLGLVTGGTTRWSIGGSTGHITANADNTYDFGATGASRPRTGYFGTSLVAPTVNATTAYQVAGVNRIYFVTADFTTAANTNLQTITGLVIPLPANTALNMPVRCVLFYSQATAAVSDSFGIQTDTVTPSNIAAGGAMETALGTTAYGDATITNTTATAVVTGTPSATATIFNAYLDAFVENPSNASTTNINIMVKTSVSGDAITIKRGSFCRAF